MSNLPGATVIRPAGDLDATSGPGFRTQVEQAASTGAPLVVVDMTLVDFLDSAGLAALFGARRRLRDGQRLALANVPRRMHRVLQLTAVKTLMDVHEQGEPWPWPDLALDSSAEATPSA